MSTTTLIEKVMKAAVKYLPRPSTITPGPAPSPADAQDAVRRCCAAWKRAYNATIEDPNHQRSGDGGRFEASRNAIKAYRNAMPLLVGYEGARDFIACTAYGILIGAIPREESGQLLYAAQVALSIAQSQRRMPKLPVARPSKSTKKSASKSARKINTPPPSPKKPPFGPSKKRARPLESKA